MKKNILILVALIILVVVGFFVWQKPFTAPSQKIGNEVESKTLSFVYERIIQNSKADLVYSDGHGQETIIPVGSRSQFLSANGKNVLFAENSAKPVLRMVDSSGNSTYINTEADEDSQLFQAEFFPDGNKLAYLVMKGNYNPNPGQFTYEQKLYVTDLQGNVQFVSGDLNVSSKKNELLKLVGISNTGNVYFIRGGFLVERGETEPGILEYDISKNQMNKVQPDLEFSDIKMSPDGTKLAIINGNSIFIADTGNNEFTNKIGTAASSLSEIAWSPDATKLALTIDRNIKVADLTQLKFMNFEFKGSAPRWLSNNQVVFNDMIENSPDTSADNTWLMKVGSIGDSEAKVLKSNTGAGLFFWGAFW